jgi:AraC-like DNA-binding protein
MAPPPSTYRERLPIPALADHVLCVWSQVIGAGEAIYRHRVLPDGCADLVWIGADPAVVAGPATGPVIVPLAPGTIVVGLRLRPGAAAAVLGPPADELLDRDTPLCDIWGAATAALSMRVTEAASVEAKLGTAEALLARRLGAADPPDRHVAAATRWLARHPAGRIEDLAEFLEVGPRRLHRRFTVAVGYGPKTFQRVFRVQRALALAARDQQPEGGLAGLALEAGYADQAHMSRELRLLTGRSPSALLPRAQSTLALSDLFKTDPVPGL